MVLYIFTSGTLFFLPYFDELKYNPLPVSVLFVASTVVVEFWCSVDVTFTVKQFLIGIDMLIYRFIFIILHYEL